MKEFKFLSDNTEDDDFEPQPEVVGREEAGAAESAGKSRARLN